MPIPRSVAEIGLLDFPRTNGRIAAQLQGTIRPFDALFCHSNGSVIAWQVAQTLRFPVIVVMFNSALTRNTQFQQQHSVINVRNSTDWVLYLSRPWSRALEAIRTQSFHGWGAMGLKGQSPRQANVMEYDSAAGDIGPPVSGHSGVFNEDAPERGRITGQLAMDNRDLLISRNPRVAEQDFEVKVPA